MAAVFDNDLLDHALDGGGAFVVRNDAHVQGRRLAGLGAGVEHAGARVEETLDEGCFDVPGQLLEAGLIVGPAEDLCHAGDES